MTGCKKLKLQNNCSGCGIRAAGFFCDFDDTTLKAFGSLKKTGLYPKGRSLFVQGQPSTGVYMLCQGKVKLSTYSQDGKSMILRIVGAGEIVGLSSAIEDLPQKATAEAIEPCQVNFIEKRAFLRFLNDFAQGGMNTTRQLSNNCNAAYAQIRLLAFSNSVGEKLARLLWSWAATAGEKGKAQLRIEFTHHEIAEMIGSSRETVTRLFKNFKDRGLITTRGRAATIKNIAFFKSLVCTPEN